MAGKYLRIKKIVMPTLTAVLIAAATINLTGCGKTKINQNDIVYILKTSGPVVELEIGEEVTAIPSNKTQIDWVELGNLTTDSNFRKDFDDAFNIMGATGNKNGVFYVNANAEQDQNNVLAVVMRNRAFTAMINDEGNLIKINQTVCDNFLDMDSENDNASYYMGILRYFNLLPSTEDGYCNPDKPLARAEAMTLLMKSQTPVDNALMVNSEFESAVGESEYNLFAQFIDNSCYINTTDGSLNSTTYKQSMSKVEYIYMLVKELYTNDLASIDTTKYSSTFAEISDGGDMIAKSGVDLNTSQLHSAVLKKCLNNSEDGKIDSELYRAMCVAYEKGLITNDNNWDGSIKLAEAMQLLCKALQNSNNIANFNATIGTSTAVQPEEITAEMLENLSAELNEEQQEANEAGDSSNNNNNNDNNNGNNGGGNNGNTNNNTQPQQPPQTQQPEQLPSLPPEYQMPPMNNSGPEFGKDDGIHHGGIAQ